MFLCFFDVVFLLLLKHKRTKFLKIVWLVALFELDTYTPFPGQSECFVAVLLTLFDSY